MEHEGEIWQEIDFNGKRLGGIDPNNYDYDKVKIFAGTAIMLYRQNNEKIEFLFQHRSKKLKGNPDKWDVSAGGHINLNEPKLQAAVREAKEEIGIDINASKLEFVAGYINGKNYINLYFYDWTGKADDFVFDDGEVEEVKWIEPKDFEDFWSKLKPQVRFDDFFKLAIKNKIAKILENGNN